MNRTLVTLAVWCIAASPALADAAFLQRFEGRFSGGGTIQRDVDPQPRKVTCRLAGSLSGPNALSIKGSCRAAVILTRPVAATIRYDPATDRFSGTYDASTTGPAQLSNGRLSGNALTLAVTYAKPIYGDRNATMTITNAGDGGLSMVVTDRIDGRSAQTSAISLRR
ncbi:hypothetical protein LUX29_17385 [Aureimonas altamirensis]|uniref:hypothetical protein n=1 Tax=Aureimonas altamirensis TaxID=370622 RepID=UPI001E49D3B4|nr:hypothetical protein [Aureimonas altamirensis]UHD44785.1 hypothetical protein LUX29_17385 [Aureimonas altamirensis]